MSLEELMAIEVSSVSRRPERLSEAASAIQVITREDIRRSGATRLPEALRLAGNLQVAQLDAAQSAISARGFNSPLANKLLVLIDGRTVYSPLFAGVFWDAQDVLLEDVEQIEVISGPGGTLWGANAVNGVINVTTRRAKDTPGLLLLGAGGTELHALGGVRYGGRIGPNAHFRVYGKYADRDGVVLLNSVAFPNDWTLGQGGFRIDWDALPADALTLQGDLYENEVHLSGPAKPVNNGGNVTARWSHRMSDRADLRVQAYVERVHRDLPTNYDDVLETYDLDVQHRIALGRRNELVWGMGFRQVEDDFRTPGVPPALQRASLSTFNAFAQDEIALVPDRLHLTVGTKLEHNEYTGVELQPSARLAWQATARQTLWTAVSRAVRTPSRLDHDLLPGADFVSEKLLAYELGYRAQAAERLSLSVAAFYHDYDDVRSVELVGGAPAILNGQEGESYGLESTARYRVSDRWQLQAGFAELRVDIRPKPGTTDSTYGAGEAADSRHHLFVRSYLDLPANLSLDASYRYVGRIANPRAPTPDYGELDLRLAWLPTPKLELSIVGQSLLHDRHAEFGDTQSEPLIRRGVYTKAVWSF
jgi:iron complex outermembrane receptor protein